MRGNDRARFDSALHRARVSAHPPGEFVGQESFMVASEILSLALDAGIGPGVSVVDLCCGVAGPGRHITRELGCDYLGVDADAQAVALARKRAGDLAHRFEICHLPPLPPGNCDVVLLLETLLAFPDKPELLRQVRSVLKPGGRFAFTLEEGAPLTKVERAAMPNADTVWLLPLGDLVSDLKRVGLHVSREVECTQAHLAVVESLLGAFANDADNIAEQIGWPALDDLMASHRLWAQWLRAGRVRKFGLVAVAE